MRVIIIVFLAYAASAAAWDDDDFEVFDVVEEVNQNFYELLGVTQVKLEFKYIFPLLLYYFYNDYISLSYIHRKLYNVTLKDFYFNTRYLYIFDWYYCMLLSRCNVVCLCNNLVMKLLFC